MAKELFSRRIACAEREAGIPPGGYILARVDTHAVGRPDWQPATVEMHRAWLVNVCNAYEGVCIFLVTPTGCVSRAASEVMEHNHGDGLYFDLLSGVIDSGPFDGHSIAVRNGDAVRLLAEHPEGWHPMPILERARILLAADNFMPWRAMAGQGQFSVAS